MSPRARTQSVSRVLGTTPSEPQSYKPTYVGSSRFNCVVAWEVRAVKVAADEAHDHVAVQLHFRDNCALAARFVSQCLGLEHADSAVLHRRVVRFFRVSDCETERTDREPVLLRELVRKFLQWRNVTTA